MHIRTPDGGGNLHRRVTMQRRFDGERIDVVAAPDDQLLLAAREPEVALFVLPCQVAGVEPALAIARVDPEPLVLLRLAVAREDIRP